MPATPFCYEDTDLCAPAGDCDHDGAITLGDYADPECFDGPGVSVAPPACQCFDLDGDGDADLFDFAEFETFCSE